MKLGGKTALPALADKGEVEWNPPEQTGTPEQIASGKALFGRYCYVCHGDSAIGNGFTPDLRISSVLADRAAWKSIVGDGALKDNGMVGFSSQISADQVEAVRHYVIERSNWTKANVADLSTPVGR